MVGETSGRPCHATGSSSRPCQQGNCSLHIFMSSTPTARIPAVRYMDFYQSFKEKTDEFFLMVFIFILAVIDFILDHEVNGKCVCTCTVSRCAPLHCFHVHTCALFPSPPSLQGSDQILKGWHLLTSHARCLATQSLLPC